MSPFVIEDTDYVINNVDGDKARGPDGFSMSFFNSCWKEVRIGIWSNVHSFLMGGSLSREINHTFVALIPKKEIANAFNLFHPIFLCNCFTSSLPNSWVLCFKRLWMVLSRVSNLLSSWVGDYPITFCWLMSMFVVFR